MSEEARARCEKEIRKLKHDVAHERRGDGGSELCRLVPLPPLGGVQGGAPRRRAEAERVLDEDHFGLEKPKERIIEYLAVQALVERMKGPILCLVGPPGVGKTSLGKSIARATGPRLRASEPGRGARRGGDPRPSPHLHRGAARARSSRA